MGEKSDAVGMPAAIRWYSEGEAILFMTFTSPWTWEDADTVIGEATRLTERVSHRVDLLVDLSQIMPLPADMPLTNLYRLLNKYPPPANSGHAVFVGGSKVITMVGETILKIFGDYPSRGRIVLADSMEEGLTLIRKARHDQA